MWIKRLGPISLQPVMALVGDNVFSEMIPPKGGRASVLKKWHYHLQTKTM